MSVMRGIESTPAGQIVELLQRRGPMRIKEIENALGVTTTAVRQQLTNLVAEGVVTSQVVREGVGRPSYTYSLTDKARTLFACHCDELTSLLYQELLEEVGAEKVRALLARVSGRLAMQYSDGSPTRASALFERVGQFASQLEAKGILSDVAQTDDGVILREYNCPYHDLSAEHREVCDMEQAMIANVLDAKVQLKGCIHDGHSGCEFVVTPVRNAIALHVPDTMHGD